MKLGILRHVSSTITVAGLAAVLMLASLSGVAGAAPLTQTDAPVLTVTSIDSANFPYVAVNLSVTDVAGAPIAGLAATDFAVSEDGVSLSPDKVSVEAVQGDPVSLVVALDISVDWQSFNSVREGVKTLIQSLGSNDQVAIIAFGETAQTVQQFTSDKAALTASLDTLVAEGVFTALNDATLQAVNLATTAPTPNRAVLLLTNSGDRSGDSSASEAVAQAQASNIPIHTVGYGENAATNALKSISDSTGGRAFDFATAADAGGGLASAYGSIQGLSYQLTFYSNVAPDNLAHTATIALNHQGLKVETAASYTAISHEIGVSIPGIEDGQTISGRLFLVAEVASTTPIASVEYLLNGQPIANVATAPYSFEWDSTTVNPGTYQLTVRATDIAGNQGEWSTTLNVSLPFAVQITAPTDKAQVGDDVKIDATVDTPAHVIQVDLLVDEQVIASDTDAPYSFTFNTKPFPAGSHTITIRATDLLGRTAESALPMRFTEALAPIVVRWAFAALIAIAIIVSFIVGLALMGSASRASKNKLFRVVGVELTNNGNTSMRYELRADDPNTALGYEFSLNGSPLSQRQVIEALPSSQASAGAAVATGTPVPATAAATSTAAAPKGKGGNPVGSARSALRVGSTIGGVLSSIGYYLPGSLGSTISGLGYNLSGGEHAVSRVEREVSTVKHVGGEVTSLGGKPAQSPVASSTPSTTSTVTQAKTAAPAMGITRLWAQTPPIDPGQTLPVSLTMRPLKGQGGQQYFFRVISQAIDAEDSTPVIEQGNITIKGISFLRRLLPFFIFIATLGLMAMLVALLAFTIGLLG